MTNPAFAFFGGASQKAATPDIPNPTTDNRFAHVENHPKQTITPAFDRYLRRQLEHIRASNGSERDAANYLRVELGRAERGERLQPVLPEPVAPADFDETAPNKPSAILGVGFSAIQGVTFGFGDEAIGSLLGLAAGVGARGGRELYREELAGFRKDHPVIGFIAEAAGGIASGGAAVRGGRAALRTVGLGRGATAAGFAAAPLRGSAQAVAKAAGPTTAGKIGNAAVQGAGFGAAFGAGSAEGGFTVEGISNRTKGMLFGGLAGGAFGTGLSSVGAAAGTVLRPLGRALTGGGTATNWQKFIQTSTGIGTAEGFAKKTLVRALVQDGLSPREISRRISALQKQGLQPSLVDVAGPATLRLAQTSLAERTPAKQRLAEILLSRQAEQGERLSARLMTSIFRGNRLGTQNADEAVIELHRLRAELAAPAYTASFKQAVQTTTRMREILQSPTFRRAWAKGRLIADDEELAGIGLGAEIPILPNPTRTLGASTPEAAQAMAQVANRLFPETLPIRGLDYTKRGLDAIINEGRRKGSLDKARIRALKALRDELLGEADKQVGSYAEARAIYRGFSEAGDAVVLGQEFFKMNAVQIKQALTKLDPVERDFFRLGATSAIHSKATSTYNEGADVARQFFGGRLFGNFNNPQAQRIRALFPDAPEAADDFMRMVAAETRFSQTTPIAGAVRGSAQAAEEAAEGAVPIIRGGGAVTSLALTAASAGRAGTQRLKQAWSNDVNDELALLFTKGLNGAGELGVALDDLAALAARSADRSVSAPGFIAGWSSGRFVGSLNR